MKVFALEIGTIVLKGPSVCGRVLSVLSVNLTLLWTRILYSFIKKARGSDAKLLYKVELNAELFVVFGRLKLFIFQIYTNFNFLEKYFFFFLVN